jgi:hypothetical protein
LRSSSFWCSVSAGLDEFSDEGRTIVAAPLGEMVRFGKVRSGYDGFAGDLIRISGVLITPH